MMSTEESALSFGHYLNTHRLEKGLDLETISAETRISVQVLRAIESEDHAHLPDEVFVKGFLRAFAKVVDANGDEAVERYLLMRGKPIRPKAPPPGVPGRRQGDDRRFWQRVWIVTGAFFLLVIGTVLFTLLRSPGDELPPERDRAPSTGTTGKEQSSETIGSLVEQPSAESELDQAGTGAKSQPGAGTADAGAGAARPEPASEPKPQSSTAPKPAAEGTTTAPGAQPEKLVLNISAVAETWMKVIADDRQPKVYQMQKGEAVSIEAKSGFNLLIGNAGGIRMKLNGRELPPPGKSGQVVTIQLP